MKITEISTIPLRIPQSSYEDGLDKTGGKNAPSKYYEGEPFYVHRKGPSYKDYVLVKIHTDEDIIGFGEAPTDGYETLESIKMMIDRYKAPSLIGKDPFDIERINDVISMRTDRMPLRHVTSAINYALYDIMGKALKVPLYTLLGGMYKNKVLASIEVPRGTPEEMAVHSLEYYKLGIRGIKAKIGSNAERDAKCLKAIRDALGDKISLRADANEGYTIQEAVTLCRLAEKYDTGLEILEQPVTNSDLDGMGRVARAVNIPIEADESAFSLYRVYEILKKEACDIINTKCSKAGGISGVKKWAAVAESAKKPIVIGTEYGLGTMVAVKTHLGAAIRNADPVVEYTEIMLHDLLLKEPLKLEDGYIKVPTKPGIGVELDEKKIEKYTFPIFPK
jgi:L-alanine-DL-glutamate epimerase-like enolase superfamily enzyme